MIIEIFIKMVLYKRTFSTPKITRCQILHFTRFKDVSEFKHERGTASPRYNAKAFVSAHLKINPFSLRHTL